jgi:hypothetical protein
VIHLKTPIKNAHCWAEGAGLILGRARVPVAPFFPGGHTENLLTVPAWHTDYFSHKNCHFLEKKCFLRHLNSICLGGKNYFHILILTYTFR